MRAAAALVLVSLVVGLIPGHTFGQSIAIQKDQAFEAQTVLLPYGFYNENLKLGLGAAFVTNGWLQKQMALITTGFVTTNGSRSTFLLGRDTAIPVLDRLFLDSRVSFGYFDEFESYVDGNPDFPNERAGSNDSHEDNFVRTEGNDNYVQLTFKYLLPIGHGRNTIINTYIVDQGLLHDGSTRSGRWNPLQSGRSYVEIEPFIRKQDLDGKTVDSELETNGIRFALRYDNTDFSTNPSQGSSQEIAITRDWGKLGSTAPWTVVEAEHSQYFSLPTWRGLRQAVLALNVWTANALTWDSGTTRPHRPPLFSGASLGGLFRMRGYPEARFHDQAAVYYAAELRLIPTWNPIGRGSRLDWLDIAWIQLVPFVEVGRVARAWNLSELHSDMKLDVGVGFRALVKGLVVRVDIAASEEEVGVQMMVGHPF